VVLELGCWPGGWLQILTEMVGEQGRIVGVDLREVQPVAGVETLQLDFTEPEALGRIRDALGSRPPHAVLCDAAPSLTGIKDVDRAAEEELYDAALGVARALLRPTGLLVVKGFPGPGAQAFRKELQQEFVRVIQTKPEGSRRTSQEFYWLAAKRRPG